MMTGFIIETMRTPCFDFELENKIIPFSYRGLLIIEEVVWHNRQIEEVV
jgi:hypothetical protein